jgi:Predicted integral membrane protein
LDVIRGIKLDFARLFDGFKDYGRILGTMLLTTVYTFLWTLLLVIPGIMKSYSYAMTLFILKDYPELQYDAAIEKSMAMMSGHKMKMFLLDLSFIGWAILCCFTLGIGFLFLAPYVEASHAAFYEDLKKELGESVEAISE